MFACFYNQQQKPKSFVPLVKVQIAKLGTQFYFKKISALHFATIDL